jgi:hypothetical protein
MHVVPKSHDHGVDEHSSPDNEHVLYSLTKIPEKDKVWIGIHYSRKRQHEKGID